MSRTRLRRLARAGARVAHVYLSEPHEHEGGERIVLLDAVDGHLADGGAHDRFAVGELRSPDGRALVMVEESC
ncbi:hypothetical protein RDV89_18380 [Nocardioides zeae]|uniref:Uncharacterized protein n=1 Tax=Nocardioides imazamoxiresistens TaxID=3231893 RepID=A0ABU3Q0N3_9ACTN|nr:hypothetical protein [Nocardioides zeae]MDT9595061.1 hypothetical protein [Nocardioides zeae]